MGMLRLIHKFAATSWGYNVLQIMGGYWVTRPHWIKFFQDCQGTVVDIGGGTGMVGGMLSRPARYICLDNESAKLDGITTQAEGILGDACCMPIKTATVDFVTCLAVTHHLSNDQLSSALRECARVLKPGGTLKLADATWKPYRLPGRLLWAIDRGANPRTTEHLREAVSKYFQIERTDRMAFYHDYVAFTCRPRTVGKG